MVLERSKSPARLRERFTPPWVATKHDLSQRDEVSNLAEAYVLGRLTDEQFEKYEEHLMICELCGEEVDLLTDLIETLRLAEEGIDPLPLHATYENPTP